MWFACVFLETLWAHDRGYFWNIFIHCGWHPCYCWACPAAASLGCWSLLLGSIAHAQSLTSSPPEARGCSASGPTGCAHARRGPIIQRPVRWKWNLGTAVWELGIIPSRLLVGSGPFQWTEVGFFVCFGLFSDIILCKFTPVFLIQNSNYKIFYFFGFIFVSLFS